MSWTRNWYVRAALYCFMQLRPTPVGCCCSRQGSTPGGAMIAGERPLRSTAYQLAERVITPRPAPIFGMYAGRQSVNTAKGASHGSAEVWRFLRLRQKCPASIILAGPVASFRNVTETLAPEEQCLSGKTHRRIAAIRPTPRRRLRHGTLADPQPARIALLHTRPGQWPGKCGQ